MITEIWLRSESATSAPRGARNDLAVDRRTPLTPQSASCFIEKGIRVVVERSADRIFADEDYERCGCIMVSPGSYIEAPSSALILGLRPPQPMPDTIHQQNHSFFCHAYKKQPNWHRRLLPFARGSSTLYDLEYLVDDSGDRLASFGRMAGSIGLAAGLFAWSRQALSTKFNDIVLPSSVFSQITMSSVEALLRLAQEWTQKTPRCLIIGANGRCGQGVVNLAASLNVELVCWTRSDTVLSGPFPELLEYDIVLNAIRINPNDSSLRKPWLTNDLIRTEPRRLSVLVDISCEPDSAYNPFPLYKQATTFDRPTLTLIEAHDGHAALDLIAIPNLPSLLPADSSEQFSEQLTPLLLDLLHRRHLDVWRRAKQTFESVMKPLQIATRSEASNYTTTRHTNEIVFDLASSVHGTDRKLICSLLREQVEPILDSILSSLLHDNERSSSLHQNRVMLDSYEISNIDELYNHITSDDIRPTLFRPLVVLFTNSHIAIAAHAAVLDQWSVTYLCKALASNMVPKTSLQYCDYVQWFNEQMHDIAAEKDTDGVLLFHDDRLFWKQALDLFAGHIVKAQLPTDMSVSPTNQNIALRKRIHVPISCTIRSHPICAQVLAALSVVIHRYTLENDFVIGTRAPFRNRGSLQGVLGPFEEQSILHISFNEKTTVQALLDHCFTQWNGVVMHQELPLRHIDSDCLGQLIEFIVESDATERLVLSEVLGGSQICFRLWPTGSLSVDYDPEAYLPESMIELLEQIRLCISEFQDFSLQQPVSSINLVTSNSRSILPDPSQELDCSFPGPITSIFVKNVVKCPNAIAITSADGDITYEALYHQVRRLAIQLRASGIGKGDIVAIYGDRVASVVWAIMAVLSTGAAFSTMDPRYPSERLITCLNLAQPRAWIALQSAGPADRELEAFLDNRLSLAIKLTLPSLHSTAIEESSLNFDLTNVAHDMLPDIQPDDIAVVTFTSGSTGLPKGVCGRHGPLTHFYPWMGQTFSFSSSDRFSMCSGIAHDPLQRDIFTPLFFGARICIPSDRTITEGGLADWMHQNQISVSCLTPAMGQLLTSSFNPKHTPTLERLRAVFFVGDSLLKSDVVRLRSIAPNVICVNMYGSTETQRAVGHLIVPDNLDSFKDIVPVGVGMQDVQLLVVNAAGNVAAVGERGEIFVRSPHFAKGYLNLPEQTSERFLQNRFVKNPAQYDRLYRTGDLGRYNSRGWVECSGRADDQVKIRGFRIELGEINARLSQHHSVKECVTLVIDDNNDKRLASFVVLSPTVDFQQIASDEIVADLRSSLMRSLPHYMVPSDIHIISSMPLTPNGKINRKGLVAPHRESVTQPPILLTNTQQTILSVWNRLLPNVHGNIDANFFDMGGHSLLATRLIIELSKAFHMQIPLQILFTNATIRLLSVAIDKLGNDQKIQEAQYVPNLLAEVNYQWCSQIQLSEVAPSSEIKDILLTGCTGFVGCWLLSELLEQFPQANIHCTVRTDLAETGSSRIQKALQNYMLWRPSMQDRIIPVMSDLSKPNFGWTEECIERISCCVDLIVHNAAHVHWLLPFDRLRPVNVSATEFLLTIAGSHKQKFFHYISTTSVLESSRNKHSASTTPIQELDLSDDFEGLNSGYAQSKWVAEKLVSGARAKGIAANIYRLGYVTGDTRNGISNTDDFLIRLIQGCIQMGSCPFMEFDQGSGDRMLTIDMSPVDYVSRTIVEIMKNSSSIGRVFHVTSPAPLTFVSFFQQVKDYGYDLVNLPYATWRQKLVESISENDSNALAPIISHLTEEWANDISSGIRLNRANVQQFSTTKFPSLDRIVQLYLSYLVRCESIPAPKGDADNHLQIDWSAITQHVCRVTRTQRN